MATPSPSLDTTLEIKRTFQASREKVFPSLDRPRKDEPLVRAERRV